jgi:propionate CoA-transferase
VHVPNQWQSYDAEYDAGFAGEEYNPDAVQRPMEFGYRKLIARRAARELKAGDVANVGVGVPDGVPSVLAEEGRLSAVHMTNEHGIFGGVTSIGLTFGASRNHEAVVPMPIMIDLYQGGLLDVTFLGFAQIDAKGNVNVSKYGSEVTGAGGFIDITQNADTVVFCGSLTAGGLSIDYTDGTANVRQEGHTKKFIPRVEQITFSAEQALERGQRVLFVTERAVFELVKEGVQLVEIAPGIDIERDLLPNMDFKPIIGEVRPMDPSLFYEGVLV